MIMLKKFLLIACLSILPLGLVACSGPTPDQLLENRINIQEFIDRGIARANAGDAKGMNVAFNQALEIEPKSTKVLVSRGYARATLKDYKGAVADQTAALAINPDLPEAYANRGTAHYRLGEKKAARADWQKAAALFKANKNTSKYNNLVDVLDQFAGQSANDICTEKVKQQTKFMTRNSGQPVTDENFKQLEKNVRKTCEQRKNPSTGLVRDDGSSLPTK